MKIVITGSSGLIGSYLFEKLYKEHKIFGLDLRQSPFTNVVGDILNYDLVKILFRNVDLVIHCAAQTSVFKSMNDPLFDAKNNIIGTLNLLEATRRSKGLMRFIYVSSASIYGFPKYLPIDESHPKKPISPYGVSKLSGEQYVNLYNRLYGLPTTCIRPFNVYGKLDDPTGSGVVSIFFHRIIKELSPIIYGDGDQTRDFIHVQDVANMITLIVKCEEAVGETFNCGTGKETSILNLAKIMISLSNKDLKPKFLKFRPCEIKRSCADVRKIQKILNYRPKMSFEQGLKKLLTQSRRRNYHVISH